MKRLESLLNRINKLLSQDKYSQALILLDRYLKINPNDPDAWGKQGDALREIGNYSKAISSYDRAVNIKPDNNRLWKSRGDALRDNKNFKEAIRSYERAIQLNPDNEWLWMGKGEALVDLRRYQDAFNSYENAIRINPDNDWAWISRGELLQQLEKYDDAISDYNRAIDINPKQKWALIHKGEVFINLKKYKKALQSYSEAVKHNPKEGITWYSRGKYFAQQNQLDDSIKDFTQSLQCFRDEGDLKWLRLVNDWLKDVKTRKNEQEKREEPSVEVKLLRIIKMHFQDSPDDDPFLTIRQRELEYDRYFSRPRTINASDSYLSVLRRWNSFTPKLPNRESLIRGGGYFLIWKGKGIVIDPGFDFIDNFDEQGYSIRDIDAVVVTHAHTDHTADFETLLCLKYEQKAREPSSPDLDLFLNQGALNKFLGWISRLQGIGKVVNLNTGDTLHPENYPLTLKATNAKHSEVMGNKCIGLIFDLMEGSNTILTLGITSDTGWSSRIQNQYRKCGLLCAHVGSIGSNEFNDKLPLRGKKRLYPEHLGLIGTISTVKVCKSKLAIISEFGEELGKDRFVIAKTLDRAFSDDKRCLTGDIGLKIRLPDLAVKCTLCNEYVDLSSITEQHIPGTDSIIYACSSHTPQDFLDKFSVL